MGHNNLANPDHVSAEQRFTYPETPGETRAALVKGRKLHAAWLKTKKPKFQVAEIKAETTDLGRTHMDYLRIRRDLSAAETNLGEVSAENVKIKGRLSAKEIEVDRLTAQVVRIEQQLYVKNAQIDQMTIDQLRIRQALIDELEILHAQIKDLEIENLKLRRQGTTAVSAMTAAGSGTTAKIWDPDCQDGSGDGCPQTFNTVSRPESGQFDFAGTLENYEVNYWQDGGTPQVQTKWTNGGIQVMLVNLREFPSQEVRMKALEAANCLAADIAAGRKTPCGSGKNCHMAIIWRGNRNIAANARQF
ncbi:MAG: hypothetical protein GF347_05010 [Candidatus Moranbacteria bacterium]|nr:hypothetical protein [Candidatus Moranbacteria bacterium]